MLSLDQFRSLNESASLNERVSLIDSTNDIAVWAKMLFDAFMANKIKLAPQNKFVVTYFAQCSAPANVLNLETGESMKNPYRFDIYKWYKRTLNLAFDYEQVQKGFNPDWQGTGTARYFILPELKAELDNYPDWKKSGNDLMHYIKMIPVRVGAKEAYYIPMLMHNAGNTASTETNFSESKYFIRDANTGKLLETPYEDIAVYMMSPKAYNQWLADKASDEVKPDENRFGWMKAVNAVYVQYSGYLFNNADGNLALNSGAISGTEKDLIKKLSDKSL